MVGLEGVWGFLMTVILLPIFQQINCGPSDLCYYGKLEDMTRAFADIGANYQIWLSSLLICFSIASFNAFGVTVTKNASAAQRSTIDTSRTVLIWIFFLAIPIPGVAKEKFTWLQLSGFILLVFGTLVYNEIIVIPYLGFDKNTKVAIAKRKRQGLMEEDGNNDLGYLAASPHQYDASKNRRKVQQKLEEGRLEGGLNKSEITVEETAHNSNYIRKTE